MQFLSASGRRSDVWKSFGFNINSSSVLKNKKHVTGHNFSISYCSYLINYNSHLTNTLQCTIGYSSKTVNP